MGIEGRRKKMKGRERGCGIHYNNIFQGDAARCGSKEHCDLAPHTSNLYTRIYVESASRLDRQRRKREKDASTRKEIFKFPAPTINTPCLEPPGLCEAYPSRKQPNCTLILSMRRPGWK